MTDQIIYYVAFYKHDQPQQLVAGPYVELEEARSEAGYRTSTSANYCVVSQRIQVELEK